MRKEILYRVLIFILIWLGFATYSNANIYSEEKTVIPGQEFTIEIKSDILLGAYSVEVQDTGIFDFITSSGQEGSGKRIITGSTTTGVNDLASFTFKVREDEQNVTGQIKVMAKGMETPILQTVDNQELILNIKIKNDKQSRMIKEFNFGATNKRAISFLLNDSDDNITYRDIEKAVNNKKVDINTQITYLKNGSKVTIDGTEYTIIIYGDVNGDGKINIIDAVTTLNQVKGRIDLSEEAIQAINKDYKEKIGILDAVKILNVAKGKREYRDLLY